MAGRAALTLSLLSRGTDWRCEEPGDRKVQGGYQENLQFLKGAWDKLILFAVTS